MMMTRLVPKLHILFLLALLLGAALPAQAAEKFCSDAPYNGVIDGDVHPVPTQITIDTDCTFQNFPDSNPLTTTVNFQTNDPTIYLIIFNNVTFTGHMACASVDHRIWFSNGSDYGSSNSCQDLFIPVESIDKQAPAATASIGVPFTYTLTLPSMSEVGGPSANALHTVTLWDDLTATGADLTYVDANAYYRGSGNPVTLVRETDPNAPGGAWTPKNLSYEPIPLIDAGEQIVVEFTVVLDDTAANVAGTSFANTAKWWFGRLIDGVFYEPLPGEWGVSEPMTIAEPDLVVAKSGTETALNLGVPATYTLDVQNVGGGRAFDTTIVDQLPDGANAGMCDFDPSSTVSARIVEAGGTAVADLTAGTDYSVSYSGCQLGLAMLSDKASIAPDQHLLVSYQSQLDGDTTADGQTLTNVAGATEWYSGSSNGGRLYSRTLADGTPDTVDHQDSYTVTTALSGYYFQKTVENLISGTFPATTGAPGDRLRYRVRLFNVDQTIEGITVTDPLDLNSFDPSTFEMGGLPAGATYTFDSVTGLLEVTGDTAPLNIAVGEEIVIEFEADLRTTLDGGSRVSNQASLEADTLSALSDDPYVNGIAGPDDPADPTIVTVQTPGPLAKSDTKADAAIGETFQYTVTVPAAPLEMPLYDVRVLDDLSASSADLGFVGARVVSGGTWTASNTSVSDTNLVIEDSATGIDIPAGGQAVIEITVELLDTTTNVAGLAFDNSASYTYNRVNGSYATQTEGGSGETGDMLVVEPVLAASKAATFVSPSGKTSSDPATVGDVLEYEVTVPNSGDAVAYDVNIVDTLPANVSLVPDSATAKIDGIEVAGFAANPATLTDGSLAWGRLNGDESLDVPVGRTLVLTYQVTVETVTGTDIENSVYVDWTSLDGAEAAERTGAGCPNIVSPDTYCAGPASVVVGTLDYTSIDKTAVGDSYAENPQSTSDPIVRVGDTVTYELTLNLQEYTTEDVAVEDAMPQGLALESFVINAASNFSYTLAAQPSAGDTGTLRWDFGDVANAPSGDGTPVDALTIRYVARVVSDAPTAGVAREPSILSDNLAQLSYGGGDPALHPDRLTAAARIDIRQPQMSALSKVDQGSGRIGSGTQTDPYQVDLSADEMNFRLSSCNEGLAPAYNAVITDLLATQFDEGDLLANPPVVKIGSTTLTAGTEYAYTAPARGGEMGIELFDSASVGPGECVTVDYDIGFHTDLASQETWSNQALLSAYRSLPAGGRLYAATENAKVWMTNLVSEEALINRVLSPAAEVTIGEEAVYEITVPGQPLNAALDNVVVSDSLPEALEFVSSVSTLDGAALPVNTSQSGQDLSWSLGTIPAGQQAVITLTTRVANNDQANAGTEFANTATYTYDGMPADLITGGTSGPLTIVEPLVSIAKQAAPQTPPSAGDVLSYTLTLTASGAGTGDAYSDAFDLAVVDRLGEGLAFVPGSATLNGSALIDPAVDGDGTSVPQTLTWSSVSGVDIDVAEGESATLTYGVEVLDTVEPGQGLTNSALGRWTGLDGASDFERNGSGSPAENDYVTAPAESALTVELAISLEKSVLNVTTGEDPGANAEPGDTLRYSLVLTNQSVSSLTGGKLVDELAPPFAPGSLRLVRVPAGADISATDPQDGANGTGLVDIRDLTLAAQGEAGDSLTVVFEATLAPVIKNGTTVSNRALLSGDALTSIASNETSTLIASSPVFELWKASSDITGDPDELMAGDTLRYTLTVENTGNEDAVDAVLRDYIPGNTSYLAGSTTMNGAAVVDPSPGVSPLADGMAVNTPADGTPGFLPAGGGDIATVTFDVVVDPTTMDGVLIENQGFLNASGEGSGPLPETPSDDPTTSTLLDPTRDVVGNLPALRAHKTVEIQSDYGSAGIVDPGDVLRYTIAVDNFGKADASGVVLTDPVPIDTAYVADSLRLNGASPGPDGGVSPLIEGLGIQSSDQPGAGIVSVGAEAVVTFDVRVDDGVASGTLISNQGTVASNEVPDEPTDADADPANGYQSTDVVVGDVQMVTITKDVSIVGGGEAEAGDRLEYRVRVTNIGSIGATNVVIVDDLAPLAGQASYVAGSGLLNGSVSGVAYDGSSLRADYAAVYGDLQPGDSAELRFRVQLDPTLPPGTTIPNTGTVQWNDPARTASASISLDLGGTPGSAALNGTVWQDVDLNTTGDGDEPRLGGWAVELYGGGALLSSTSTDSDGIYRLTGLLPNDGSGETYELRFRAPDAGPDTASLGTTSSTFTDGPQRIADVTVASGDNLQGLDLPITPNGVIYDSVKRSPVTGARLRMLNAATDAHLPGSCFEDPVQQGQATAAGGYYKFDLNFGDASCQPGGTYYIEVTPPATGYTPEPSRIIPSSGEAVEPFFVPDCPGSPDDAVPATNELCEVSASADAPQLSTIASVTAASNTAYHLFLTLSDGTMPGHSQVFNNHIPVDPVLDGAISISKTSPVVNASKGELVPYTITLENIFGSPLENIGVVDRFPAGFKYVEGSARMNGASNEPTVDGRQLLWEGLSLGVNEKRTIRLLLVVGSGVAEGEYVNRAQVINTVSGGAASGEATATVRVVGDPTFDCTDVIGKVFDDRNLNGRQDDGEPGLTGCRVVTARGLIVTTDEHGRFHIACAAVPDGDRGSNFILKLDDRSLPTGYRVVTENPRVQRATRGKMMKFNFGATVHRIVGIDIADGAFEPDTTRLRLQWTSKFEQLIEVLRESPAVLRLSYLADVEEESLVRERLDALKEEIIDRWNSAGAGYRLTIETEVFWRRGGPM